jgi:hypothetical protein
MKRGMTEIGRFALTLLACAAISQTGSTAQAAPARATFDNGLAVTIYPSEDLRAGLTTYAGSPALRLEDGRYIPVITGVNDPTIYNKGDGAFHPFATAMVEDVLASITHPRLSMSVRVYLLPYPRRGVLVSSTSGSEIFLSPHVLEIEPSVGAYIIAHELGHAFHNRFMPDGSGYWDEYRRLRGITNEAVYSETATHANRPREILAEDFRVLFGGEDAAFGGQVENTRIAPPASVPGLASFFVRAATEPARASRIAATSYPNPFNPETEIRIQVPSDLLQRGDRASVRVYDVRGALVRTLHEGNASGDMVVRWDGRDDRGSRVASATYFAAVQIGDERQTVRLVLLK